MSAALSPGGMPSGEARRFIREAAARGRVAYSHHALKRMALRGLSRAALRRVLRTGAASRESGTGGRWRYTVSGRSLDGEAIDVVTELDPANGSILVITAWRRR